jgi:hypothetical protein
MILNAWFFIGVPDPVDPAVEKLITRSSSYIDSGVTVIPAALNCQLNAMIGLKIAEAKRVAPNSSVMLWPSEFGQQLTDGRFRMDSPELVRIIESATKNPVVIISGAPMNQFNEWVRQSPLQSTEQREDQFIFTKLTKR